MFFPARPTLQSMKFRETIWFKMGSLEPEAKPDPMQSEQEIVEADVLPIEDRYLDDGSVKPEDSAVYGLHTGRTQGIVPMRTMEDLGIDERILIGEMKRGRRVYLALLAGGAAVMGSLLFLL